MALKKYLRNVLEDNLSKIIDEDGEDEEIKKLKAKLRKHAPHAAENAKKRVRIADIKFAFRNHELIDKMAARGKLISS